MTYRASGSGQQRSRSLKNDLPVNIGFPSRVACGTNGPIIPELLDLQQENHIFTDSMGISEESVLLKEPGQLKEFEADRVTGNAFQFLGVPALIGRGLLPRDAEPGAPPIFVLNYSLEARLQSRSAHYWQDLQSGRYAAAAAPD